MNEIFLAQATTADPEAGLVDPIAKRLGYLLRRASAVMMADLGASLTSTELRPVEATIITLVGANPGCTQSDIGRMLGIKRANMVPLMSALADKGLVAKARVDGRSQALTLTDAGEGRRAEIETIMDRHEARFENLLSASDAPAFRAALKAIAGHAGDEGG